MREFLAAIGIEIAVGIVMLIAILVAVIWRKLEMKIEENRAAIAKGYEKTHTIELSVVELQTWKQSHNESDAAIHQDLKNATERQIEEVGSFRVESSEQHKALLTALASSVDSGRTGRERLHDKVEVATGQIAEVDSKVERLIGSYEEQKRFREAK